MDIEKKDLSGLRNEIDGIDSEIIRLFCRRMETAEMISEVKRAEGMPVFDPAREREKLAKAAEAAGPENENGIKQLYSLMFEISRDKQYRHLRKLNGSGSELYGRISEAISGTDPIMPSSPTVACQGTEGAFSTQAAEKMFSSPRIEYVRSFANVIRAVETGYARYGILPLENSTAGEVTAVRDLLAEHGVYIVRAARCMVDHALLANPGTAAEDIREIVSHEMAINQCSRFLSGLDGVKITFAENTAVAAKAVRDSGRRDIAAIASRRCAELYGLDVLSGNIRNTDNNHTRFICVSRNVEIYPGSDRTSVMLTAENRPGSLYRILSRFYALGINLTSIISRPIEGRDFSFRFFMDFETPVYSEEFADLMNTIEGCCEEFRYLGSYREII